MLTKVNTNISFWKQYFEGGENVKEAWTGDAVAIMHVHNISATELAGKVGWNPKYLSSVLNCKRCPKEAENVIMTALHEMVDEKSL